MNGTAVKVIDASALAAIVFDEPEAERIAHRLRSAVLTAPPLLWFEMVNVCLTKLHRSPGRRDVILQAFAMQAGLPIESAEVDHANVLRLAEQFGLTGYDASYLWLAQQLDAELVTLDRKLALAAGRLRPK